MQTFFNCTHRLAGMDVRTGRYPDSLQARVGEHGLIRIIDGNFELLVLLKVMSPFEFMGLSAADCHN